MVELVDTRDLKSLDVRVVPVQVRPGAPSITTAHKLACGPFLFAAPYIPHLSLDIPLEGFLNVPMPLYCGIPYCRITLHVVKGHKWLGYI